MNIPVKFSGVLVSTKRTDGTNKDGQRVINEYAVLDCNGDVGYVSCKPQVFADIVKVPKYTALDFTADYESWEKKFVITSFNAAT